MTAPLDRLEARYIEHAHEGNGTGCRCCSIVDDGALPALIAVARAADRLTDLYGTAQDHDALEDAYRDTVRALARLGGDTT